MQPSRPTAWQRKSRDKGGASSALRISGYEHGTIVVWERVTILTCTQNPGGPLAVSIFARSFRFRFPSRLTSRPAGTQAFACGVTRRVWVRDVEKSRPKIRAPRLCFPGFEFSGSGAAKRDPCNGRLFGNKCPPTKIRDMSGISYLSFWTLPPLAVDAEIWITRH